mmetsp:Transcript_12856/g.17566  ORF Transcript_12856/g.17566 Transcript_12856/m.17566 type:complete len:221 (+) Transcript_12856:113-775(+)
MTTLTADLILEKTKAASLEDIKNLNLWGSELKNVSVLACVPNVEVLSLSVNRITELEPFGACRQLQELYLRKNEVRVLDELDHLISLSSLRVLWLVDNPCADVPDYRARVIAKLPQLHKLDHNNISEDERQRALSSAPFPIDPVMAEAESAGDPKQAATARPPPRAPSSTSNSAPYPAPPASAPPQLSHETPPPPIDPSAKKEAIFKYFICSYGSLGGVG